MENGNKLSFLNIFDLCAAAALACLPLLAVGTAHGSELFLDLTSQVAGHAGMTYADLLKPVMPDLVIDGTSISGQQAIAIPNIENPRFNLTVPERVTISLLAAQRFEADGKDFIAILAPIGEERMTMLAVFEDREMPVLVDAVDVGLDSHNNFATPTLLQIAADSQALVTSSWHLNAGEYYELNALVFLRQGKLELIDTFSPYSESSCSALSQQSYTFSSEPESPYYTVTAALNDKGGPLKEEPCEGATIQAYDHSTANAYQWDAGAERFVASGH